MDASEEHDPGTNWLGRMRIGLRGQFRAIIRCLGWRLVIILTVALAILLGVGGTLALRLHEQHLVSLLEEQVIGLGETILSSTHSSMMENDRHHLAQIVENIGRRERVRALRLIDARGEVRFSSHPEEVGVVSDVGAPPCLHCHTDGEPRVPSDVREGLETYPLSSGEQALGLGIPVLNAPECWQADCHVHPEDQQVLGILNVELSTAGLAQSIADARAQMTLVGVLITLVICTVLGLLAWRVVHRPIHSLLDGTGELARGDLAHRISTRGTGELGDLATSFNTMASRLQEARDELEEWGQKLEVRVDEKTRELEQTRDHMVFAEKMVSLGKLAAIVAHEVNNPLAGILVSTKLVRRQLRKLEPCSKEHVAKGEEIDRALAMVERETARCGDIVRNLLLFSRRREAMMGSENVNLVIDRSVKLVQHQADLQEVTIVTELDPSLPEVTCDAGQIEQACLALIMNAIEAMPDGGTLRVSTRSVNTEHIRIDVIDTGIGIPGEMRNQIFEPFFSTKTDGKGTGLGLSVLYGIVQRHHGKVDFSSERGLGTTFWIELPLHPQAPSAESEIGAGAWGDG